ncbi:MAG: TrmJ/YjtD family RNA methyltransferase [Candidatus Aminicenantes bacterium]|nr:TrmJ/YjtD family RNA methyltransferase [Candidatus Aminicenantes bacterium]
MTLDRVFEIRGEDKIGRSRIAVVLVSPESQENIGLVARAMKNTGFSELRITGISELNEDAFRTAVHSGEILRSAKFFPTLKEAVADCNLVFGSTARRREKFQVISLDQAIETIFRYPPETKIALVFGPERTGLSSEDLEMANFVYSIPQASSQPSYNLAAAVLLTLYQLFIRSAEIINPKEEQPATRADQEELIQVVLRKLREAGFINDQNKAHISNKVHDLFGRMALTDKDRKFLTAILTRILPYQPND